MVATPVAPTGTRPGLAGGAMPGDPGGSGDAGDHAGDGYPPGGAATKAGGALP
jgi:hypothetical protein